MTLLFSVTIKDCDVHTFTVGGPGGGGKDTSNTGVRIVHRASGAVGRATETRSQDKNKRRAFLRLAETKEFKTWHKLEVARIRRLLTGTVSRAEYRRVAAGLGGRYVRTYNFADNRVKDHTTNHTRKDIQNVMNGEIESFIIARILEGTNYVAFDDNLGYTFDPVVTGV